jgi:hypothetical protein
MQYSMTMNKRGRMSRRIHLPMCILLTACAANSPTREPLVLESDAPLTLESVASWSPPHQDRLEPQNWPPFVVEPLWPSGALLLQGFFGVTSFDQVQTQDGSTSVDGDDGDLDQLPLLGGGGQWKIGGERIDAGIEGMFTFAGRANATAFATGSNGAVLVVDADIMLFELYAGPFVNVFLGDKWRVYAAAGPLWQWANYDQNDGQVHDTGTGYGFGTYARTGIETMLPSHAWVGFGVRWSKSEVDLGDTFGQLEVEGVQFMITVSAGI